MTPLIFTTYPTLEKTTPHKSFAELPTPIEQIENYKISRCNNVSYSGELYVKRDDLTHREYGGNKVRKLEFIIAEALSQHKTEIVTFGAIGTNHGVATALFCKKYGLKCTVILFDQPVTKTVQNNLNAMAKLGAKLVYKKSIISAALSFYRRQILANKDQYFLFAGGSNVAGCLGFVNAAFELRQQIAQQKLETPNYIYCPIGSSATLAGLTLGCFLSGIETKVIGVRVAPSHVGFIPACTQQTINKLMQQTHQYLQARIPLESKGKLPAILMENDYFGDGYGMATQEASQAIHMFQKLGITLEATYTAKTVAALLAHRNKEPNKTFLYWHTFNSSDMQEILNKPDSNPLPRSLQKVIQPS